MLAFFKKRAVFIFSVNAHEEVYHRVHHDNSKRYSARKQESVCKRSANVAAAEHIVRNPVDAVAGHTAAADQ